VNVIAPFAGPRGTLCGRRQRHDRAPAVAARIDRSLVTHLQLGVRERFTQDLLRIADDVVCVEVESPQAAQVFAARDSECALVGDVVAAEVEPGEIRGERRVSDRDRGAVFAALQRVEEPVP
jgi:hypothetical protein